MPVARMTEDGVSKRLLEDASGVRLVDIPFACTEPTAEIANISDLNNYSMGSFTAPHNTWVVFFVITSGYTGAVTPAGGGLTWTLIASQIFNTTDCIYAYRAFTGAGPVTLSPNVLLSSNATGCCMMAFMWTGAAVGAATPIRQSKTAATTAANPAVTFDLPVMTVNGYMMAFGMPRNPPTSAPPASWTEIADTGYATPAAGASGAFRVTGETASTFTFTSSSAAYGIIGVEIRWEDTAPGGQPTMRRWGGIPGLSPRFGRFG